MEKKKGKKTLVDVSSEKGKKKREPPGPGSPNNLFHFYGWQGRTSAKRLHGGVKKKGSERWFRPLSRPTLRGKRERAMTCEGKRKTRGPPDVVCSGCAVVETRNETLVAGRRSQGERKKRRGGAASRFFALSPSLCTTAREKGKGRKGGGNPIREKKGRRKKGGEEY